MIVMHYVIDESYGIAWNHAKMRQLCHNQQVRMNVIIDEWAVSMSSFAE
jgi:hypothetical protein